MSFETHPLTCKEKKRQRESHKRLYHETRIRGEGGIIARAVEKTRGCYFTDLCLQFQFVCGNHCVCWYVCLLVVSVSLRTSRRSCIAILPVSSENQCFQPRNHGRTLLPENWSSALISAPVNKSRAQLFCPGRNSSPVQTEESRQR